MDLGWGCAVLGHGLETMPPGETRRINEQTYRDHVPPGGPVDPKLLQRLESQPLVSGAVDDEGFIERTGEEQSCQQEGTGGVDDAGGPVAHEMQGPVQLMWLGREQGQGYEGADGRGQ